jgi:hypothetical protein
VVVYCRSPYIVNYRTLKVVVYCRSPYIVIYRTLKVVIYCRSRILSLSVYCHLPYINDYGVYRHFLYLSSTIFQLYVVAVSYIKSDRIFSLCANRLYIVNNRTLFSARLLSFTVHYSVMVYYS